MVNRGFIDGLRDCINRLDDTTTGPERYHRPDPRSYLSLLLATTGRDGDPNAKDPVERTSSRLQAVACLIGPTDYLNYGSQGVSALGVGPLSFAKGPFDFVQFNEKLRIYEKVTDEDEIREIGKSISPLYHITADDPPTLFVHGTADRIVPLQQALIAVERLTHQPPGASLRFLGEPDASACRLIS